VDWQRTKKASCIATLKPTNIFVTNNGPAQILDFGPAKLSSQVRICGCSTVRAREGTEPGMVLGTVGYMSPEEVRGKTADHHADLLAFGAILFEMLTGKRASHTTINVRQKLGAFRFAMRSPQRPGEIVGRGLTPQPPPGTPRKCP
jgi:serine/threonine protein kinase